MVENVVGQMNAWERLGVKEDEHGSRLIAHTPRDFPQAYLHAFFVPLPDSAWADYGIKLPEQLKQFYSECNGLRLFGDQIAIYGLRQHNARDASAAFQPFDLMTHDDEHRNFFHPIAGHNDERVFFGSYDEDGSGIYTTISSTAVHRCLREECDPVNTWPDIETFLSAEYARLEELHTEDGYLVEGATPLPEPD